MRSHYILFTLLLLFSCNSPNKNVTEIDFTDTTDANINQDSLADLKVYIAIASMTSPQETFAYYNDLIKYVSDKVGYPIFIKQKKTYEEVNEMLENEEVDFAFICSGAFADEYKKGRIKLLVAPEINQAITYQAYVISNYQTEAKSFSDFEKKSFAFTDPLSNTGRAYPQKRLMELQKKEANFFSKTLYTYGHDISIQMVNRGIIDGASVHGLIYNYQALHHPEKVENTFIVEKSEDFGMPPIVTPSSLDKRKFNRYQEVFLELHNDSIGKTILNKLLIDRYIIVNDSIYKSVFDLKEYIGNE